MFRVTRLITLLLLMTGIAQAEDSLSDFFAIIRTEGRNLSAEGRTRTFQIYEQYATGKKSLDGEWPAINDALGDSDNYVRNQACAVLGAIALVKSTAVYGPPQKIPIPGPIQTLLIQRFDDALANTRENAVRIVISMAGGVPPSLGPKLLQMAKNDSEGNVREIAVSALASIPMPSPAITEFWITTLSDARNKQMRGYVLHAFRFYAPSDGRVISLVVDALKDQDHYVKQEAIASVIAIGKPAAGAVPLLMEVRDAANGPSEFDQTMRQNAEAAIRKLSESVPAR